MADLILDLISLDYHETLFAAAGHQADAALKQAMAKNAGKNVCIVEGIAGVSSTASSTSAATFPVPPADAVELLYDATLCIGCKACVVACQDANGLPLTACLGS